MTHFHEFAEIKIDEKNNVMFIKLWSSHKLYFSRINPFERIPDYLNPFLNRWTEVYILYDVYYNGNIRIKSMVYNEKDIILKDKFSKNFILLDYGFVKVNTQGFSKKYFTFLETNFETYTDICLHVSNVLLTSSKIDVDYEIYLSTVAIYIMSLEKGDIDAEKFKNLEKEIITNGLKLEVSGAEIDDFVYLQAVKFIIKYLTYPRDKFIYMPSMLPVLTSHSLLNITIPIKSLRVFTEEVYEGYKSGKYSNYSTRARISDIVFKYNIPCAMKIYM